MIIHIRHPHGYDLTFLAEQREICEGLISLKKGKIYLSCWCTLCITDNNRSCQFEADIRHPHDYDLIFLAEQGEISEGLCSLQKF